jgi:hypothetical protein
VYRLHEHVDVVGPARAAVRGRGDPAHEHVRHERAIQRGHGLAEHARKDVVVGAAQPGLGESRDAVAVVGLGDALHGNTDLGAGHG